MPVLQGPSGFDRRCGLRGRGRAVDALGAGRAAFQPALRRRVRAHAAAARVGEGGRGVRSEPAGLHGRVLPHVQGAAGDVRGARRRDQGMRAVRLPVLPAVLPAVHVRPHRPKSRRFAADARAAPSRDEYAGLLGPRHPAPARRSSCLPVRRWPRGSTAGYVPACVGHRQRPVSTEAGGGALAPGAGAPTVYGLYLFCDFAGLQPHGHGRELLPRHPHVRATSARPFAAARRRGLLEPLAHHALARGSATSCSCASRGSRSRSARSRAA